ncbi:MAG: FGGY-family carbohydrate kinase [Lachnospiraceae bacterium]|nr:FGGY-family carbohydrate kinase [Lachnospiraceae bacterium]
MTAKECIANGRAVLGIELGSTRIKAVLNDENNKPIAQGSHEWENRLENGVWTYHIEDVWTGLADCYADLLKDVKAQYGIGITKLAAIGFSAMMHGYVACDGAGNLLVPFRTWRNTITGAAAETLTKEFNYNIPQRWSIAHLYQAILNGEPHVKDIKFLTTLAGYLHWQLTGQRVMGVGEASGMFPIDIATGDFNNGMIAKFDALTAGKGYPWKLRDILPKVLTAGDEAGKLTAEGAKKLDVSGQLEAGIPLCPPEGDAGTGMVATNSVAVRTGNVSAGTSVFAMVVLEKELSKVYPIIDLVTTPSGKLVGMVHCNNCTSDINAWVGLLAEFAETIGAKVNKGDLYTTLFNKALEGDPDCGGLLSYNYFSGESVTGFDEGRLIFARTPDAKFTLANFMRTHIYSALATLKYGCDVMFRGEGVKVDTMYGHGGLFKTKGVGQGILAAAINAPVSVMETAGEGGAWGMAILASYMVNKAAGESLDDFLNNKVFGGNAGESMQPVAKDVEGFDKFMEQYVKSLPVERAAVETL